MSDIWFRGEGSDVKPAQAGKVDNDIGDGMYLTDQLEVAKQYAHERSPNPDNQRVYKVPVTPNGMKVLDLTTDPRWKKHMNFPMPPTDSSGQWSTPDTQLKRFPSSKLYKQHFENFLSANKINLSDYDAVIGAEYRSGGKQMCILFKNGQPSAFQGKLRLSFVPIGHVPTPSSPSGSLQFGGKIGPGLKFVDGTLFSLAVGLLISKFLKKLEKADIEMQMKELSPKIESDTQSQKRKSLQFLVDGKQPFATILFSLTATSRPDPPPEGAGGTLETIPALRYESLEITDSEVKIPDTADATNFPHGVVMNKLFHTVSIALTYSQQEVELYRSYLKEINWFDEQLKISPSAQDTERLNKDRETLVKQLENALSN